MLPITNTMYLGTSEKYHLLYLNLLRKEMYNSMIYSILLHCPVANVPRYNER